MIKIGLRKLRLPKWVFYCIVTTWPSLRGCHYSWQPPVKPRPPTQFQFLVQTWSQRPQPPVQQSPMPTQMQLCGWLCLLIVIAIIVGILAWIFIAICRAIHRLFGNRNNDPPEGPGNNGNILQANNKTVVNADGSRSGVTASGLPYTSFSYDIIKAKSSTSTDTNNNISSIQAVFASLFVVPTNSDNGFPSGVGMWQYTGNKQDSSFGTTIDWTGALIYQFSVQSSTNLVNWRTRCTVVGWATVLAAGPSASPWVCQVVYTNSVTVTNNVTVTNGIPISTNWVNAQIAWNGMTPTPTNIVAYGSIVPIITPGTTPKEFYRLVCTSDTNADLTIGP